MNDNNIAPKDESNCSIPTLTRFTWTHPVFRRTSTRHVESCPGERATKHLSFRRALHGIEVVERLAALQGSRIVNWSVSALGQKKLTDDRIRGNRGK